MFALSIFIQAQQSMATSGQIIKVSRAHIWDLFLQSYMLTMLKNGGGN